MMIDRYYLVVEPNLLKHCDEHDDYVNVNSMDDLNVDVVELDLQLDPKIDYKLMNDVDDEQKQELHFVIDDDVVVLVAVLVVVVVVVALIANDDYDDVMMVMVEEVMM